jgi:hypothetical protein
LNSNEVSAVGIRNLNRLVLILGASVLLAGCGGGRKGPATIAARGVVKYRGKPVPKLSVGFVPEKGQLASGTTDAQGRFTLMTNKPGDGAMVGNYNVGICFVSDEIPEMPAMPGAKVKLPPSPIPEKYADPKNSGLAATVDKDASKNNFTFELED